MAKKKAFAMPKVAGPDIDDESKESEAPSKKGAMKKVAAFEKFQKMTIKPSGKKHKSSSKKRVAGK